MTVDETESADKKFQKELISGASALVLLTILNEAAEPMYGYQIAKVIDGQRRTSPCSSRERSIRSSGRWRAAASWRADVEPSVSGPPRRYYQITELGRTTLARWREMWDQMRTFVDTVMKGEGNGQER